MNGLNKKQMIELDAKTSIGTRVTDGKKIGTITDFGDGIHEMGTARMGKDPKTSVLNKWNACHDVPNLFVTDGSFMTSSGCQNPSLTYMAFTARAANYAVEQMKKGIL
jgi:choline dehydrogenase-like flavoprotein